MTYGEIRYRVTQQAPTLSLKLIDGWFADRYSQILDRLKWKRNESDSVLQTVAPYATGTLAIAAGGTALTLTGGTFTAAMTGRAIQIDGRSEWYEFTFVGAGSGTIDRAYEGSTVTAAAYSVSQFVYRLAATVKLISSIANPDTGPLERMTRAELLATSGGRQQTGAPAIWAPYMDDSSTPPRMQIQLYPTPDAVYPLMVTSVAEAVQPAGTSTTLLPWVRPAAIVAGVLADAFAQLALGGDAAYGAASVRQEGLYEKYVSDMVRTEYLERGPQPVRMASWLTRHNTARAIRGNGGTTGPGLP